MTGKTSNPHLTLEKTGYEPGHPWYYLLGGKPLSLRDILEATRQSGYRGYARERIANLDNLAEPKRSQSLRAERDRFRSDLRRDIHRYRACVRELRNTATIIRDGESPIEWNDVYTALSLKHNHMVNNFGHLILLDELLSKQRDLFDL